MGGDAALAGQAFYDRLQNLLGEAGFDAFVEGVCKPYYAARIAARTICQSSRAQLSKQLGYGGTQDRELGSGPIK